MRSPRRAPSPGRSASRVPLRSLLVAAFAAAVATVVATVAAPLASPAGAVQTDDFGLRPAGDSPRAKIEVPASGATVRDAVVVYNRTNRTLSVDLGLVGVSSPQAGQYSIGDVGSDVSKRVRLAAPRIELPPGQQANVPVTLTTPRGADVPQWAAIVATAGDTAQGGLAVRQRLAVLVGFTPTGSLVPLSGGVDWWWLLIVLLVVAVTAALWYHRRRRRLHGATVRGSHRRAAPTRKAGSHAKGNRRRPLPVPVAHRVTGS